LPSPDKIGGTALAGAVAPVPGTDTAETGLPPGIELVVTRGIRESIPTDTQPSGAGYEGSGIMGFD